MSQKEKRHELAIESLLECETITEAAQRAGMSRQHLTRLLRDPDFKKALGVARSEAHNHSMSRLCRLSSKAVSVLAEALEGKDVPKGRFLAARAVLEFTGKIIDADLESRLAEVEEQLERMNNETASTMY
ncbi:MAG: AraC family transcriptional regulator [Phycisphaerae bacterium]|nr:AraC family transcriptional regulator [Phycisphaerae bacterium]